MRSAISSSSDTPETASSPDRARFSGGMQERYSSSVEAADCLTEGEDGKGMAPGIVAEILANPEGFYVNVHNNEFPNGAVRAQLAESHDH